MLEEIRQLQASLEDTQSKLAEHSKLENETPDVRNMQWIEDDIKNVQRSIKILVQGLKDKNSKV